jgi:hypothetical protein
MSRITCTVELADGTVHADIRVLPLDIVRMERHYGVGLAKLEKDHSMLTEHGCYLAWSALTRSGKWSGDFETFLEQVADASPPDVSDDGGPVPSPPAP